MSPFLLELLPLCPQTICWEPLVSRDAYASPTYGPIQTFRGRRVFKNERVAAYERGTKGQGPEVLSASQIWILATPDIKYEDRIYVQGDDPTKAPPILSVQRTPDETGDLYVKVMLGSANG